MRDFRVKVSIFVKNCQLSANWLKRLDFRLTNGQKYHLIWTWILKYCPEGGVIESFRLPFVSEASEGRSDELGRNYLSWDTWKKNLVKKYLFFAKLQPVEVGGEAKIHWFWCIFTKGIIRENPLPQLRPPQIFELASRIFFDFYLVKGFDIYFKFYASGGLSELTDPDHVLTKYNYT